MTAKGGHLCPPWVISDPPAEVAAGWGPVPPCQGEEERVLAIKKAAIDLLSIPIDRTFTAHEM